jgi:release factor glutamine methyltransferase
MSPNVLDYEPSAALFVPQDDPLLFYRRIADAGQKYLSARGSLYFEINPRYADELSEMLAEKGYRDIVVSRDISGKNRFLKSVKQQI